jgi:L-threonylcarbamoyladenylate synthase
VKVRDHIEFMQTDVIAIDAIRPEPLLIERAAALLRAGEVVVFPTETVYGLGADALQLPAVVRIFEAKGRPFHDPLIVHIAERETLNELTTTLPTQVEQLVRTFWPGPLTLILPRSSRVPGLVSAGLPTVGVRMPNHPVALALIRAVGSPIAAPSANRFMHVSPTTAQHALADLQGRVPLILDAGPCTIGVESTILDLCAEVPTILRPGGVSLEALRTVLPDVQLLTRRTEQTKDSSRDEAQRAPGQMLTHYAPSIPLFLFDGGAEGMRSAMLREVRRRREQGEVVGVLVADEDVAAFHESGAQVVTLGNADVSEQVAAALFTCLRSLEEAGVDVILCRSFETRGLGLAIRDRLLRAASGNVIYEL